MTTEANMNVVTQEETQSLRRFNLSRIIIWASILILLAVSLLVFTKAGNLSSETVFTAIIGLVGTWVGTVLAFYFSKDNFEAASESTRKLLEKVSPLEEVLQNTPSKDEMLPIKDANYLKLDPNKALNDTAYKLNKLITDMGSLNRLPVLNHDLSPRYIIHRSIMDKVISDIARQGKQPVADLSLQDLDNDGKVKQQISCFVTVSENDTLSTTKTLMENKSTAEVPCADAFVIKNNQVIGWITNVDIARHAKV